MPRKTGDENRQHVLATAGPLFYRQGIRAVGMDQIIKAAGVGNATVYRQFPTKDQLATAWVQERADAWFDRMRTATDAVEDPRGKLLAVFDVTDDDVRGATYRGCPMLNTNTEFPDPAHPAHAVAVAHKLQICDWFRTLAEEAGAKDPQALAEQLLLVLNGILSTAAVLGAGGPARQGKELVRQLIGTACR